MKEYTIENYKFYYDKRDGWHIVDPDGFDEYFGGTKEQVEFFIGQLIKTKQTYRQYIEA